MKNGGRLFVCRFRDDVVAMHSWAIGMGFSCWIFFLGLFVSDWYAQSEIGCSLGPWLCWRAERRNMNRLSV